MENIKQFIFVPKLDQIDYDCGHVQINKNEIETEYKNRILSICLENKNCVAVNTLGYLKSDIINLTPSPYFSNTDGIYVKKDFYVKNIKSYIEADNEDELYEFFEKISFDGPDGKTIIFTNTNSWYTETLILNLIKSHELCNKIYEKNDQNYLARKIGIICTDEEAYMKSKLLGYDCCMFKAENMLIKNALSVSKQEDYRRLTFVKILIIYYALLKNYTILYIDPDMSFNVKYLQRKIEKDANFNFIDNLLKRKNSINYSFHKNRDLSGIVGINKHIDNVMAGTIFYNSRYSTIYLNSNLILSLPSEYNKQLFRLDIKMFDNISDNVKNGSDEVYINRVGRRGEKFSFWSEYRYPNGLNAVNYKDKAFMFHANCISGLDAKINLLKSCDGWYLDNIPILKTIKQWNDIIIHPTNLIAQASLENGSDGITNTSIGISYNFIKCINHYMDLQNKNVGKRNRKNILLCSFSEHTDKRRQFHEINRKNISLKIHKQCNVNNILYQDTNDYITSLFSSKFVICPEGNGIDTHRLYEALICKCIPIVERGVNETSKKIIEMKYGNCPILFTDDYSEITIDYLENKYNEMNQQIYDFSNLLLDHQTTENINEIVKRGNFWCDKFLKTAYYT